MFCKFCGSEFDQSTDFCPTCGKFVSESKQSEDNQSTGAVSCAESIEDIEKKKDSLGKSILIFSILGLVFGYTGVLPFLGIIFAMIARSNLKKYSTNFGETTGCATVGKHLSLAAMITSVIATVMAFFSFIFGIISSILATIISTVSSNIIANIIAYIM